MSTDDPSIAASARKHGVKEADMIHAFNHPVLVEDLDDGLLMVVGAGRSGNLLEVGVATGADGLVIIHAMAARARYLRS